MPNELTIKNYNPPKNCTISRYHTTCFREKLDVPPFIAKVRGKVVQNKTLEKDVKKHPRIYLVEHCWFGGNIGGMRMRKKKKFNPIYVIDEERLD